MYNIITRQTLLPPFLVQNNCVDRECARLSKKIRQLFRELVPEAFPNETNILEEAGVSPDVPEDDIPYLESEYDVSRERPIDRPDPLSYPDELLITAEEIEQGNKFKKIIELYNEFIQSVKEHIITDKEISAIIRRLRYLPTDQVKQVFIQAKDELENEHQMVQQIFDKLNEEDKDIIRRIAQNVETIQSQINSGLIANPY